MNSEKLLELYWKPGYHIVSKLVRIDLPPCVSIRLVNCLVANGLLDLKTLVCISSWLESIIGVLLEHIKEW